MKEKLKKIPYYYYIFVPFAIVVLIGIIRSRIAEKELENNKGWAVGEICSISKRKTFNSYYHYKFVTKSGEVYFGDREFAFRSHQPFLHKYFPVVYQLDKPDNNNIIIYHQDFENYNLIMPDSLLWVKDFESLFW